MTVSTSYAPLEYTGNGSTDTFSVSFPFIDDDHLVVLVDDVIKVLNTDYTVTGGGGGSIPTTGSVVFDTAPVNATDIVIRRVTPRRQPQNYVDNAKLPADVLESQLDRLTLILQEIDYTITQLD